MKAFIPKGKYADTYTGWIAIRFRPRFKLTTGDKIFDVHPKYIRAIHKADAIPFLSWQQFTQLLPIREVSGTLAAF